MDDIVKCYKILGLEPGAQLERVRKSYLELFDEWDPSRHAKNPILHFHAEQKREEIEEAYRILRRLLPDLPPGEGRASGPFEQNRDFMQMSRDSPVVQSKAALGILVALVSIALFAFGFYLLAKSGVTPVSHSTSVE